MTQEEQDQVDGIRHRLANNEGVELQFTTGQHGMVRVVLIPAPLYNRTVGLQELLISCEGAGALFYDGAEPLNEFRLIAAKFPSAIAKKIAALFEILSMVDGAQASLTPPVGTEKPRLHEPQETQ